MSRDVQDQNRRYYDAEAEAYDGNRYGTIAGQRVATFHKKVLNDLMLNTLPKEAAVLEMGCGTGRLLGHLGEHGYQLHGVDMSAGMLAIARRRLVEARNPIRVELHLADAAALPFPDAKFDGVYSILVLNLMPNYEEAFREVARVLKPGGLFVFNVPNLASIYFLGGLYVNARRRTIGSNEAGHRYSHWFTPREWRDSLLKFNFRVDTVLGQPPHLRMLDGAAPLQGRGLGLAFSKSVYVRAIRNRD
jgi:ubiquinone/menaquinone biosynthesis C-methylase UbiE